MEILDTTLRDGSYVNNFQFTGEQTFEVVRGLDEAGIRWIEVGHGIGLGASEKGYGKALESDRVYMEAAKKACKSSKWGVFAIPGIANNDDLELCADLQADFVRIGIDIDEIENGLEFVKASKAIGLFTCVNFMKSYTKSPVEFEIAARKSADLGADIIYIVDSAGSMTPRMVSDYCSRLSDLKFGFHGHNNLGLANANALLASELGACIVDTSILGLGRSSGNTSTEEFVALMQTMNKHHDVNLLSLIDLAEKEVRKHITGVTRQPLDLICGLTGFHSSYMPRIKKYADKYRIDPRLIIIELCSLTRSDAPEHIIEKICKNIILREKTDSLYYQQYLTLYTGEEQI